MAPPADEPTHDVRADRRHAADSGGALLCRIAEQDLEAYELLYGRYARPVYGLALRRLRDPVRAEDATREVFATIWRSAATYVPERGDGLRWMFTVARTVIVAAAEPREVASSEAAPEPVADVGWPAFCVHAAVAELPEQERVPLELACWGNRSQSEVAELLGLPLGTVQTRTRDALVHLAGRLEGF
jgi:RNA polymerase sigma-70 factor, ECF subfamily